MSNLPFKEATTANDIDNILDNVIKKKHNSIISSLELTLKLSPSKASRVNKMMMNKINNAMPSLKKELESLEKSNTIRQPDISHAVENMLANIDFKTAINLNAPESFIKNKEHIERLVRASLQSPLTVAIYNHLGGFGQQPTPQQDVALTVETQEI